MAAETPSPLPPSPPPPPPLPHSLNQQQYWCHHCEKRVYTETLPDQPDVICSECKFGFVESIPAAVLSPSLTPDLPAVIDEPTLSSQFLHVLRLISQVARDDHPAPPSPPPRASSSPSDDFLRIEIDSWSNHIDNDNDNNHHDVDDDDDDNEEERDDDDGDEEDEDVRSVEIEGESDGDGEDRGDDGADDEDMRRRLRRDVLRLPLRDLEVRARSGGRNRILDWAEILMGLENNSMEFRFEMPDRYVGDPGDYVDAAEYEALLQNLADAEGKRGAPPASKEAVEALKVVEIREDNRVGYEEGSYACAICKDGVSVGDVVNEMPCGHGYHAHCIVPWLSARNSCPVCRFELPTDDPDYEQEKRKQSRPGTAATHDGSSAFGSSSLH